MKTYGWVLIAGMMAAGSVFAAEVLPHATEVKLSSVRLVATNGGINPAYKAFNIVATAEFSNECMIPENMAKEVKVGPGRHREYRVLAISKSRACPMVYLPVTRDYVIDQVFTQDDSPSIVVNDLKAE
jgi:hypothetical protein